MLLDIRPWSAVDDSVYFAGVNKGNPYKRSTIFSPQRVALQSMYVLAPNKPIEYISKYKGVPLLTDPPSKVHDIPPRIPVVIGGPAAAGNDFIPSIKKPFPPAPSFRSREIGNCRDNGDSAMKNLPKTCGCPAERSIKHRIHSCCRKHLLKLIKAVFTETVAADIPMMLTGGALIGWSRDKKLVPYDKDVDAGLQYKHWSDPKFLSILDRLAAQGFCVWFRTPSWTKIWSTVVAFDLFAFNIVEDKVVFFSTIKQPPYNRSKILPPRTEHLEGVKVFVPNTPKHYLDNLYGEGRWQKPWYT